MKKILALLLAILLLAGLASAAFTDAETISGDYTEAVAAMSEKGVIGGFPDGTFRPKETLTRAQAAKIICTMLEGADKVDAITATAEFTDVPASNWASKFIGYCADKSIVAGVGGGRFNPDGKLTCAAFAKMLLVAYGHDAEKEGLVGANWLVSTQKALRASGMNYRTSAADEPMTRENACQMAYNFLLNAEIEAVEGYTQETVNFTASNVKLLGRAQATDAGVVTSFSGDGVEFTLDCKGTIELNYSAKAAQSFIVIVDGAEFLPRAVLTVGGSSVVGCRFVAAGEHTIRILQDTEVNTSGLQVTLSGITVACKKETMKPTAANKLYVEFIGDSITAGDDVGGTAGAPYHAVTQAYSYMTAERLDADYAILAKGGIGFVSDKWQKGVSPKEMFLYQNAWVNKTDAAVRTRMPDVVVIAVGQNDPKENEAQYHDNLTEFAKLVRQTVGSKAKIVMIYNMMTDKHAGTPEQVASELGSGYYAFKMPQGNSGVVAGTSSTRHPGKADSIVSSEKLAEYIKSIL